MEKVRGGKKEKEKRREGGRSEKEEGMEDESI